MPCSVVVCGFFGDTGKGKVISYLALKDKLDVTARAGVGPNAGHTVLVEGKKYGLSMLPSAFMQKKCRLLIGPGVLVNPEILLREAKETESEGRPCNAERALRKVKLAKEVSELKRYLVDVPLEVNTAIDEAKQVLIEGTQGTYLSLYHGTYPYVTSKDVTASAACSDVGVGPTKVDDVIVVLKAFTTRVGAGPLPDEISLEEAQKRGWIEYGTVTGRPRRAAPFNFALAKRAVMLNGATKAALTKIDTLFPECKGVKSYDKLSKDAKAFVTNIEEQIRIPVTLIGTGQDALEMVDRRSS